MKRLYAIPLLAAAALSASATDFNFSYTHNDETSFIGFDKAETYDVAILIDSPSLNGTSIKGISVDLPGADAVKNGSAWISSELALKRVNGKYVNNPDIAEAKGSIENGKLTVQFDSPYTISGPLYVGYTFTVSELNEATSRPVAVSKGYQEGGLYLHSSRTKMKWGEYSLSENAVSTMNVTISGELASNAAAFRKAAGLYGAADRDLIITVPLENHGLEPVKSIGYEYSLGDFSGKGDITLSQTLDKGYGNVMPVEINLGNIDIIGPQELNLTVTQVNGQTNADPAPTTAYDMKMYPFIPVNRPLVEEYTGLWCGYCPQGYVAMETMRDNYPDRYIGLVYHSGDPMSCNFKFPSSPGAYPAMYINRDRDISAKHVYTIWPEMAETFVNADLDVEVEWADDSHSAVRAKSKVRFIEDMSRADYSISYALVIDGLSDPSWVQTNYYAGRASENLPEMQGKYGHLFTNGDAKVTGLTFNDVVIALPDPDGLPGSIPSQVTAGEVIEHSFLFNLNDVKAEDGKTQIIQDPDKLRVVASIIDNKTGFPINSNTSLNMAGESGLSTIGCDSGTVVETRWYDFSGRSVTASEPGLYIKVEILSNGNSRFSKVIK